MSEGFISKTGQSFDSHHVLALPQPEPTSEPTFHGQQQTNHFFENHQAQNHQIYQRVVTNNGVQGGQWPQPQQQRLIVMQRPQQVIVSPKTVAGQSILSHPPSGQFQLHPVQIQQHPSSSIDSQRPKVFYLIQRGTSGAEPFQQLSLIRQSTDASQQSLRLQSPGSHILQRLPTVQGINTQTLPQQQPHFQQMSVHASPVHGQRPPKQPRLADTQVSQSPSAITHLQGFSQHSLPRQIIVQGPIQTQQSQILQGSVIPLNGPNFTNSIPVQQQVLNVTQDFQEWTTGSVASSTPVRYILKTSALQPSYVETQPSKPAQQTPSIVVQQPETMDLPMQNTLPLIPHVETVQKKWIVPMSEWTTDYKNLVVDECIKHKILPQLLADTHKVKLLEMRTLIKTSNNKLLPRYKINKHEDLAKLFLKSLEANPASYTEGNIQEGVTEVKMECQSTPSRVPLKSSSTNQITVQTPPMNNAVNGRRIVPNSNAPQVPTTNQKGQTNHVAMLEPGKLVLCKNCGCLGSDLDRCPRCKKLITKDCKIITDMAYEKNSNTMDSSLQKTEAKNSNKKSSNQTSKPMSPELIQLTDDDEDDDDDDTSSSTEKKSNVNSKDGTEYFNPYEAYSSDSESLDCESLIKSIEAIINRENEPDVAKFTTSSVRIGVNKSDLRSTTFFTTIGIMLAFKNGEEVFDKVVISNSSIQTVELCFHEGIPNFRLGLKPIGALKLRHQLRLLPPPAHDGKILICGRDENSDPVAVTAIFNERIKKVDWETMNNFDTLPEINFSQEKGFIPNVKYCNFPPTDQGSVYVYSKDYACLRRRCYLNDVIIDFYLKWLQHNEFSEADRNRTHIFSSFFYNRLTMKNRHTKISPNIKESRQIGAQRRYDRVKRWTKNVNIFEKDFVIVPINENSHWFVAIICFPGLLKSTNFETGEPCQIPERQIWATRFADKRVARTKVAKKQLSKNKVIQIGSTSVYSLKNVKNMYCDENPDCDEASDSDEEFVNIDEEDLVEFCKEKFNSAQAETANLKINVAQERTSEEDVKTELETIKMKVEGSVDDVKQISVISILSCDTQSAEDEKIVLELPKPSRVKKLEKRIKQPCILIFDSLSGTSRTRVAATLRGYLKCEYKEKMGQDREFNRRTMRGCVPKIVQQPNTYDCGIFVLKYIECFFKKPINDYCLPVKQCKNWFTLDEIKSKRSEIAKVIESLTAKQNPNCFFEYPDLTIVGDDNSEFSDDEEECSQKGLSSTEVKNAPCNSHEGAPVTNVPEGVTERSVCQLKENLAQTEQMVSEGNIEEVAEKPSQVVLVDDTAIDPKVARVQVVNDALKAQLNQDQLNVTEQEVLVKTDKTVAEIPQQPATNPVTFSGCTEQSLNTSSMVLSNAPYILSNCKSANQEVDSSARGNPRQDFGLPSFSSLIVGGQQDTSSCHNEVSDPTFEPAEEHPLPSFSSINAVPSNSDSNGVGTMENFDPFDPNCSVQSFSSIGTSGPVPSFSETLKRDS